MKLYHLASRGDRQVKQLSHERKKKEKYKARQHFSSSKIWLETFVPFWNVVGYQGSTPPYDSQGLRLPNHTWVWNLTTWLPITLCSSMKGTPNYRLTSSVLYTNRSRCTHASSFHFCTWDGNWSTLLANHDEEQSTWHGDYFQFGEHSWAWLMIRFELWRHQVSKTYSFVIIYMPALCSHVPLNY